MKMKNIDRRLAETSQSIYNNYFKAKKGENVDAEISSIAKTINNGRRNK